MAPWTKRHTQSQQLPVREQLSSLQGIVCLRYRTRPPTARLGGAEDVKWMRKHVSTSLPGAAPPSAQAPPVRCHSAGDEFIRWAAPSFQSCQSSEPTPSDWTGPTDSTAGWDTLTRGCSHCPQIEQEIKGLVHLNNKFTPVNCLQYHKGPSWLLSPNIQNTDALRLYDVSAALRDAVCFYWVFQSVRVFNLWISCRSLPLHRAERRVRSAWAQSLHPACVSVGLSGYSFMKLLWTEDRNVQDNRISVISCFRV